MKNKKIIYLIIVLLVIGIAIVSGILLKNKNIDKGDIVLNMELQKMLHRTIADTIVEFFTFYTSSFNYILLLL